MYAIRSYYVSSSLNSDVIVINIGIEPKGFIKVKKDVKPNKPKVNISFIMLQVIRGLKVSILFST